MIAYLIPYVMAFTSGGTGYARRWLDHSRRDTSLATATIQDVQLASGTYAAGTAAGTSRWWREHSAAFSSRKTSSSPNLASGTIGTDDATVTAPTTTCYFQQQRGGGEQRAAPRRSAVTRVRRHLTGKGFTVALGRCNCSQAVPVARFPR